MRMLNRVALMILVALAMTTFAQDRRGVRMKPRDVCDMMGIEGLTEAQQQEIASLRGALQKALLPLKGDLEVAQAELKKMKIADSPNPSAIDKKIEAIGRLRVEMQKLKVGHQLEISKLLNEEQKAAFRQRMLEGRARRDRMMKMMSKSRGFGGRRNPAGLRERMEIENEVEITD